jgi:hypothetical protein
MAVTYRNGGPIDGGDRRLAIWRRTLAVGRELPTMVLPLDRERAVLVDLETTYRTAATLAYLS